MLVEVPDSMAGEIPALIAGLKKEKEQEGVRQKEIDRLNDGDHSWLYSSYGPIGRESFYSSYSLPNNNYLFNYLSCRGVDDPPVIMKGARHTLHRKYCKGSYGGSCPNGWHEKVAARYVRMSKITCFFDARGFGNEKQMDKKYSELRNKIQKKFRHSRFVNPLSRCCVFYINGEEIWNINWNDRSKLRMVKSLYKHVKKIENIDKQLERISHA